MKEEDKVVEEGCWCCVWAVVWYDDDCRAEVSINGLVSPLVEVG